MSFLHYQNDNSIKKHCCCKLIWWRRFKFNHYSARESVTKSNSSAESDFVSKMSSWNVCINFDFHVLLPTPKIQKSQIVVIPLFVYIFADKQIVRFYSFLIPIRERYVILFRETLEIMLKFSGFRFSCMMEFLISFVDFPNFVRFFLFQ